MLVFASVDPERERSGLSQPVRVLHHDEPKRRGNVQTRSLSAQRCFYSLYPEEHVYNTHESNETHAKHCFKKQRHTR